MKKSKHHIFESISDLHKSLSLGKVKNPLISVISLDEMIVTDEVTIQSFMYNFYTIFLKKNFDGKIKYGQQYYDFDSGVMTFYAPQQLISVEDYVPSKIEGWMLAVHPDFIQNSFLGTKIKDFGFFSYAANEALHLSDDEEKVISDLMIQLQSEINKPIDPFSQDVMVSQIDLLLSYCNRFYNRQFITRKKVSNDVLVKFEKLLSDYFLRNEMVNTLPNVSYFADNLNLSVNYLNDLLKSLTGLTTQQHIQNYIIEKTKNLLATTNLSVAEIAYQLGFEYPQSLNKLFKNKTNISPLQYKNSLS